MGGGMSLRVRPTINQTSFLAVKTVLSWHPWTFVSTKKYEKSSSGLLGLKKYRHFATPPLSSQRNDVWGTSSEIPWCAWCAGRPTSDRLGQSLGQAGRRLAWGLVWNSGTNGRGMGWVAYRLRRGLGPAGCCWRKRLGWSSWWSWWSVCPRSHSC